MKNITMTLIMVSALCAGTAFADINPVVRSGSSRSRVAEVQRALGACGDIYLTPDGIWGPRTTAATKAFQRDNGISPVGYVGSLTAEALNDCYYGNNTNSDDEDNSPNFNTNTTTNPVVGVQTGQLCPNGMTFVSNCTQSPYVAPVSTSSVCPNGMTLASNCTLPPNSVSTVPLCPNGATVASNCTTTYYPGTVINNQSQAEGSLVSISRLGSYNNTRIYAGDRDIPVLGIQAIARDADQRVEGFVVSFKNTNTATNTRINRYASEISVWLDGREIGRKSALSYSDESNDTYTYRFTGMNGLIARDRVGQIVVAVSAVSSIDSADANNDAWSVSAGSSTTASGDNNFISAASPNGRYRDYGTDPSGTSYTTTIDFDKAGGINSVQRFRIAPASNNPLDQTVQVSETSDTYGKLLLSFDARAEGGRMLLQRLPVTLTATSSGTGVAPDVSALVRGVKLYVDGRKIADESVPTGSSSVTVTMGQYSKLREPINANSTVRFEVWADYNDIEPGTGNSATEFDSGDKISAKIQSSELSSAVIELDNYYQDTVNNRTGSVLSGNQTLRAYGVQATMGTATSEYSTNGSGAVISRTIRIPVRLRALDNTVYISQSVENALTATATASLGYIFEDSTGSQKAITHSATLSAINVPTQGNAYRLDSNVDRDFVLTVVLNGVSGENQNQYRVQLGFVNSYINSDFTGTQSLQLLEPANLYESPYYTLNLN